MKYDFKMRMFVIRSSTGLMFPHTFSRTETEAKLKFITTNGESASWHGFKERGFVVASLNVEFPAPEASDDQ